MGWLGDIIPDFIEDPVRRLFKGPEPTRGIPTWSPKPVSTAYRNGSSPATFTLPSPTRGGGSVAQLNLGEVGQEIAGGLVDIGLDLIRRRLGGSTTSIPSAGNVVPGTGLTGPAPQTATRCPDGTVKIPFLPCADVQPGGAVSGGGMFLNYGEAVNGRFGAALVPMTSSINVRRCPRGSVLGKDGLCYNRGDLKKHERFWVPGRKPLLTGGDLAAISRAARAANKMKTQQRRLQKLGLLARPKPRGGGSPGVITRSEAAKALRK